MSQNVSDYHARTVNLSMTNFTPAALTYEYRQGHRDARHAAAEIALEAEAEVERLQARVQELEAALQLMVYRFETHLEGKPVRDADEVISAANLALRKARGES